jgi:hypothetical protein
LRVERQHFAAQLRAFKSAQSKQFGQSGSFAARFNQGLSFLIADQLGELLDVGIREIGCSVEDRDSLPCSEGRDILSTLVRGRKGSFNVRQVCYGNATDRLAAIWRQDVLAARRICPSFSHQHFHSGSPQT